MRIITDETIRPTEFCPQALAIVRVYIKAAMMVKMPEKASASADAKTIVGETEISKNWAR